MGPELVPSNDIANTLQRTLTFLPHGKFIGRWADANVRKQVSDLLEGIHLRFDIPINIASLESRLKTREELKSITMPCHTPEQLKLYKKEYANMWAGRKAWPGESEASRVARHTKFKEVDAAKQRSRRTPAVKEKNAKAGKEYRRSEGGKAAIARAKPRRNAKAKEKRDKVRADNAQQPGETDEAFEKRDRARKAEQRKRDKYYRDRKQKAETLKGGQQQLGAFFKPSNVIAADADEESGQSDIDEDTLANESDFDNVENVTDDEDEEDQ